MTKGARALAAAVLLPVCSAQMPLPAAPALREVSVAIETANGAVRLRIFPSIGVTLDVRALRFSYRPYAGFRPDAAASPQPARVDIGPVATPDPNAGLGLGVLTPIVLARPARPGMYLLSVDASPGFARDASGQPLPLSRAPNAGIGAIAVWWPDESRDDADLRDVRARFADRVVHAFGGASLACPAWGTGVGPETALRTGAVTREAGRAETLAVGSTWIGDAGFRFIAVDPIAIEVVDPSGEHPPDLGGSGVHLAPCAFVLRYGGSWHVDTALTTAAPPPLPAVEGFRVRPGMSRDEVVWRAGYPDAYGTAASFRAQDRWAYVSPAPFSWSVTFANDRVVAVDAPGRLP